MRSKKFKFLIALLLVIALAFSLVACVNDKDNDDDEDVALTVTQLIDEMSKMLQSNLTINNPRNMNIDIVGDASLSESADNNRLWRYEAIVKANIGLGASSKEQDTNLRLELNSYTKNDEGVDVKTTLFALLYESEVNANGEYTGSYFYLVLPGSSTPLKINGVALLKLIAGADEAVDKIDISTYFALVANLIFETGEKTDTGYKFTIDMFKVWEVVSEILGDTDQLSSIIGSDITPIITEINKIIPEIFGNLTYKGDIADDPSTPDVDEAKTGVDIAVSDVASLIAYVDQNLPSIKADVVFNFNKSTFAGAKIDAVYQARNAEGSYNAPTHKFNMNISKLYIGMGNTVAYDENFIMDAATRKAMAPTGNLLTFSIDGKMYLDDNKFNIAIDSNLNPLLLLDGFDFGKLDTLGYFNLEVTKEDGTAVLALQLNPEMKAIIVSYASPGASTLIKEIFIGGIYNYQALGEYINILSGAKTAQTVADAEDDGQDAIGKILNAFLSRLDFSNISSQGLVINKLNSLVKEVFDNIDLDLGSFGGLVVSIVQQAVFVGADNLRLTINEGGVKYGSYDKTEIADIDMSSMRNNDVTAMLNPALDKNGKQTMSTQNIQTKYELGEPFKINFTPGDDDVANTFTVNGFNYKGEKTNFQAVYYGNTYNPNVSGAQKAKIYFGLNSKLADTLKLINGVAPGTIPSNLPLYGIYCMEVDIEVYAPVQSENALLIINGSTGMLAGENIADNLNATLRYRDDWNNVREAKVTNDMISCNKPVIANNSFMYLGKYTITVNYKGIKVTQLITVSELQIVGMPSKLEIGKTVLDLAEFKLREYNDKGEIVSTNAEGIKVLGVFDKRSGADLTSIILDENGVLIANWENKSKSMYIDIGYQVSGAEKVKRIEMTGFNYDDTKIFGMDTASTTLATNSALESTKLLKDYKITVKELDDSGVEKSVPYYISYDKTSEKFVANKTVKVGDNDVKVELAAPYTIEVSKIASWNTKSCAFDTLVTPSEYDIKSNGTKLPVGKYNFKMTYKGVSANKVISVYPPFYLNSSTLNEDGEMYKNETVITQIMKFNIETSSFTDANMPEGNTKIDLKFDKEAKTWKLCYATAKSNKYIEVDKTVINYTLVIEMKSGDKWVAPTYSSSGSFNYVKNPDGAGYLYTPYKIDFSMTYDGVTSTFSKEINIF